MDLASMLRTQVTAAMVLLVAVACAQIPVQASGSACAAVDGQRAEAQALVERIANNDGLYAFLVRTQGKPSTCKAGAMGDDDQVRTWVEFRWGNGTTLRASHSPPEVSETVVRSPHDLASIPGLQQALRGYAAEKGLAIAWSAPVREPRRDLVDSEYRDPDPGLNAIVRLSHDKAGRLVSISLSMAP